jgi:CubicO group peptidase (beta-lactamase class C family)
VQVGKTRWCGFGADQHSQFEIGSITKTFTGALLGDALVTGRLKASTPVSEIIETGDSGFGRVTLGELASHRSGLPRLAGGTRSVLSSLLTTFTKGDPYFLSAQQLLDEALASEAHGGAQPSYSNFGFGVLGELLARSSGTSYRDLLETTVLAPLGMRETICPLSAAEAEGLPRGRDVSGRTSAPWTLAGDGPAGAIRSTAGDMALYAEALLGGWKPGAEAMKPRVDYTNGRRIGLAWLIDGQDRPLPGMVWHNGGTGGYRSFIGLNPARSEAVVLLSATTADIDGVGAAMLADLSKGLL